DYGVTVDTHNIDQRSILQASLTVWGVPADPSHDAQRCESMGKYASPEAVVCDDGPGKPAGPHPSDSALVPFLRLPTSCAGPQSASVLADSWEAPGEWESDSFALPGDVAGSPLGIMGCGALDFSPTLTVQADTTVADSPTGLSVDLHIPQNENPAGFAEADLKKAVVTLPEGVTVNPSSANGLA